MLTLTSVFIHYLILFDEMLHFKVDSLSYMFRILNIVTVRGFQLMALMSFRLSLKVISLKVIPIVGLYNVSLKKHPCNLVAFKEFSSNR